MIVLPEPERREGRLVRAEGSERVQEGRELQRRRRRQARAHRRQHCLQLPNAAPQGQYGYRLFEVS